MISFDTPAFFKHEPPKIMEAHKEGEGNESENGIVPGVAVVDKDRAGVAPVKQRNDVG